MTIECNFSLHLSRLLFLSQSVVQLSPILQLRSYFSCCRTLIFMSRTRKCILSRDLMVFYFFFFFDFLKKMKVDKGLVKFFKFANYCHYIFLCLYVLRCGCKLPLLPPIFLGAVVYVSIYMIYLTCARQRKCIVFSKWSKAKEYSA